MAEQLSWKRDGERLALHGELDQDFLVSLWDARTEATQGVSIIDLSGLSRVKKQQTIYGPLMEYLADNRIHALSIKAYTPQEWARDRKLNGF